MSLYFRFIKSSMGARVASALRRVQLFLHDRGFFLAMVNACAQARTVSTCALVRAQVGLLSW